MKLNLTKIEIEHLQSLAAYCGYVKHQERLDFSDPAALIRALANLPPEKWDSLKAILTQSAK